jgi:DNA (cytosine-5)-methyltransferase 1
VRLAIDSDEAAQKTYQQNHPSASVHTVDLSRVDASGIARLWEESCPNTRPVGVVGGPPCQAFSVANARPRESDARRDLPARYALLLKGLNDRFNLDFFVFENVTGLLSPRHKDYYARLLKMFEDAHFTVWPSILDAQWFGVPQRRKRLFVVGLNRGKFGRKPFNLPDGRGDITPVNVRQAIEGLPEAVLFKPGLQPALIPYHPNHWTMVPRSPKFENGLLKKQPVNGRSFRVLKWDAPSWTISFGHREVYVHPLGHRRLSVLEAMLLQGFPPTYQLVGTLSDQLRLASDAVPPPLAHGVALVIRDFVERATGSRRRRPRATAAHALALR